jgi:predicted dinucleotide-utilizing enzyme
MKTVTVLLTSMLAMSALADAVNDQATVPAATMHRYVIERTFPAGALAGLDAATKEKVNANNASVGVRWVESLATPDQTKTYCVYEGPSEAAIREAAELNHLPVDRVTEVPVTVLPH